MNDDIVAVTVDRPLWSYHPKYNDLYYPINYGVYKGCTTTEMLKSKSLWGNVWR